MVHIDLSDGLPSRLGVPRILGWTIHVKLCAFLVPHLLVILLVNVLEAWEVLLIISLVVRVLIIRFWFLLFILLILFFILILKVLILNWSSDSKGIILNGDFNRLHDVIKCFRPLFQMTLPRFANECRVVLRADLWLPTTFKLYHSLEEGTFFFIELRQRIICE